MLTNGIDIPLGEIHLEFLSSQTLPLKVLISFDLTVYLICYHLIQVKKNSIHLALLNSYAFNLMKLVHLLDLLARTLI